MSKEATVAAKLDFTLEKRAPFYAEAQPLFRLHWEEIAKNKGIMRLNPDEQFYEEMERQNRLVIVGARVEGKLVGYFIWIMTRHAHYYHVTAAHEDIHYLLPEYRRGLNGYLLIKRAIAVGRRLGAATFNMREKVGHEHPALMERLGFKPLDIVYQMVVGPEGESNG